MSVVVTGATGTVGSGLIPRLFELGVDHVIAVSHRGGRSSDLGPIPAGARLTALEGDITEPGLGWAPEVAREVTASATGICHLAGSTQFGAPLQEMRRINVRGTENVLRLAERCARLQQFAFASTVYVSGRRVGPILEDELTHDAGFVNTYEQSKYEAELMVERYAGRLPVAVYRISTILGDSGSGTVRTYTAPHQALRILSLGLASMLPGTPDYRVNLVPSDIVTDTLAKLMIRPTPDHAKYHLAAPTEKCFTLQEMIDEAYGEFEALIPGWVRRRYPKPAIVELSTFDRFMTSVRETGNPLLGGVLGALGHFAHQLAYPKTFDLTRISNERPDYAESMPDVRSYFKRVVAHCVRTGWGTGGQSV